MEILQATSSWCMQLKGLKQPCAHGKDASHTSLHFVFNNQLSLVGGVCLWSQESSSRTMRSTEWTSGRKEKFCRATSKPLNWFPNDSGQRTFEQLKTKGDTKSAEEKGAPCGRGGSHHSPCVEGRWVVLSRGMSPVHRRACHLPASIKGHRKGLGLPGHCRCLDTRQRASRGLLCRNEA